ncbi:MAG: tRNA preQ1(34) S-adenosylmethionine ribosyltransferase-isomerase QueA [Acidimicrobiales bacterium]|nr:tRNA preQ1(34) S-adenosylmethionine ribosyltransferase-isomerase QueA [Acidimicrobiales bacterium]
METAALHYDLPDSAIAQQPMEPRDAARLLVVTAGGTEHLNVRDLDALVDRGDILVVNDTKVMPARLHLAKATGGAVEVLLLSRLADGDWEALVRPSRRVSQGSLLYASTGDGVDRPVLTVGEKVGGVGPTRRVRFMAEPHEEAELLQQLGEVPLPPYIHEHLDDPERYQTVFARRSGSVAAPTAGLHLTEALLGRCEAAGVVVCRVELEVGLGTFRPITVDRVEDHPMHAERYRIPAATLQTLEPFLGQPSGGDGPKVIAVGTTTVRALESWAATGLASGETSLFIHGDYPFRVVDRLMTNFHVPGSSLLAMVEAFAGPGWRELYSSALENGYRFLSFGDAMLIDRRSLMHGTGGGT